MQGTGGSAAEPGALLKTASTKKHDKMQNANKKLLKE